MFPFQNVTEQSLGSLVWHISLQAQKSLHYRLPACNSDFTSFLCRCSVMWLKNDTQLAKSGVFFFPFSSFCLVSRWLYSMVFALYALLFISFTWWTPIQGLKLFIPPFVKPSVKPSNRVDLLWQLLHYIITKLFCLPPMPVRNTLIFLKFWNLYHLWCLAHRA